MSVMIDLPPALEREVQNCSLFEGTTLEQLFLDYLWKECERKRAAQHARVAATSAKRRDLTPDPDLHCEINAISLPMNQRTGRAHERDTVGHLRSPVAGEW